jgi:uroporphyrinogen III methyltransferase/synthase
MGRGYTRPGSRRLARIGQAGDSQGLNEVPLAGKRVLVTRPRDQAGALCALLAAAGAEPVSVPAIAIAPLDPAPLQAALARLANYDWLVFTSVNGVQIFFRALAARGEDPGILAGKRICAIGPATAAALTARGLPAPLQPRRFVAESVAETLIAEGVAGRRVLLPRAAGARPILAERLRAAGAVVEEIPIYAARAAGAGATARTLLQAGEIELVTFTSASTVHHFLEMLGAGAAWPDGVRVACIGPITADAARAHGLPVDAIAAVHTGPGLVQAIVEMYEMT